MNKSIIVLLGLLVFLLPMGSSMTAMGIADNGYYPDRHMRYTDDGYGSDQYRSYQNNDYKQKDKDSNSVSINKLNCINTNININGDNSGDINVGNKNGQGTAKSSVGNNGEGYYYNDYKKSFDCLVSNNNTNTNIVSTGGANGNQTIPPEPTTASLTVKKQVFGCNTFPQPFIMDCSDLRSDSMTWLNCNIISSFSNPIFCQSLPESIFDIEVLDDQNTQIQQFIGSENGITIPNLEPGTYTVNEIKSPTSITDQLGINPDVEGACISAGFTDGGRIDNSTSDTAYSICFEYEDEQDNDCSTITLAAGESRTCIVKNYIFTAVEGRIGMP